MANPAIDTSSKSRNKRMATMIATIAYILIFAIFVPLLLIAFGLALDRFVSNPFENLGIILDIAGNLFILIGMIVMFIAILQLYRQGRGFPVSSLPPRQLVTSSAYQFSRHPIYLGACISFFGISLVRHSFWATVLGLPLFTSFFITYALAVEEPVLLKRFGKSYQQYRKHAPVLFPIFAGKKLKSVITRLLNWLSGRVNHPLILNINHGKVMFFFGYGAWCGLGVGLGLVLLKIMLVPNTFTGREADIIILIATATGLLGSRLGGMVSAIFQHGMSIRNAFSNAKFVSWGVLAGFLIMGILFHDVTHKSCYVLWDASFVSLMVAHVFGRIGCVFYGCCFGKKTESTMCLIYHNPNLKAVWAGNFHGERLIPVQILSSSYGGLIAIITLGIWTSHQVPVGLPTALMAVLYGFFRFNEEWLRYQTRYIFKLFSVAQLFSLLLVFSGMAKLTRGFRNSLEYYPRLLYQQEYSDLYLAFFILPLLMGLITMLVFSYHRHKIGQWTNPG